MNKFGEKILKHEELGIIFFPITALYIAPLFHELGHILMLKFFLCPIKIIIHFSFVIGISGYIEPLCELTPLKAVLTLSAGMFMTLIISFILFFLARKLERKSFVSILVNSLAVGFFSSSFIDTLFGKGDIFFILKIIGLDVSPYILSAIALILITIAIIYFWRSLEEEIIETKI